MNFISSILYSIKIRIKYINKLLIWSKYGNKTKFHFNNANIIIGDYTYGVPKLFLYNNNFKLVIGKFCSIAADVHLLLGGEHNIYHVSQYNFNESLKNFPNYKFINKDQNNIFIGNDVWLGKGVTVLSGVKIGDGAIIGAGAIVSKDIPPYAVAVGNPIRIIKYRFTPDKIEKLLKIKWWDLPIEKINYLIPFMNNINTFFSAYDEIEWEIK